MPTELLSLANAFSGVQLAAVVYMVIELRHMSAAQTKLAAQVAKQAEQIEHINSRLANVMGRLHISTEDIH